MGYLLNSPIIMNSIYFFVGLFAFVAARPEILGTLETSPTVEIEVSSPETQSDEVYIVEQSFITPNGDGEYSHHFETSDGTRIEASGDDSGPDGAVETQGTVRFFHPSGQEFVLKYVANAEGAYQPESSALPVAPAFPHPIPAHALAQIEKAAREHAERAEQQSVEVVEEQVVVEQVSEE